MSVNKVLANTKARGTPFQAKYEVEYGLQVVSRDANGVVNSANSAISITGSKFRVPNASVTRTSNSLHHLTDQTTIKSIAEKLT